jgi:hypothetical protein
MSQFIKTSLIVEYRQTAIDVLTELNNLVRSELLPDLNIDLGFCENMIISQVKDIAEQELRAILKNKPNDFLGHLVANKIKVHLANNNIRKEYLDMMPETHRVFLADKKKREILLYRYAAEGINGLLDELCHLPFAMRDYIVECVVSIWPITSTSYGQLNMAFNVTDSVYRPDIRELELRDMEAEKVSGFIDNVMCIIDDLGCLSRLRELVSSRIHGNPYDVWDVTIKPGGIMVVEHVGDFRILEWHRANNHSR